MLKISLIHYLLLLAYISFVGTSIISAQQLSEYQLKAGYVINFIKLTEFKSWPAIKNEIVICIFGNADTLGSFASISKKPILRWILRTESNPESGRLELCDVVFLSRTHDQPADKILNSLLKRPVLTIGESENFIDQGGMIRLFEENNLVRFEISQKRAESVGIGFSSKLLSLAKVKNFRE